LIREIRVDFIWTRSVAKRSFSQKDAHMHEDRYGQPITTNSDAAASAYRRAMDLLLSAWPGALPAFEESVAADSTFALAHLGRARMLQMTARIPEAKAALAQARVSIAQATAREQGQAALISRLLEGDAPGALGAAEVHLSSHPRDALVLSLLLGAFGLYAFSGRADHDQARVTLCESLAKHYEGDWWFAGYMGWALTEAGRRDEGLRWTELALERRPRNANAAHALAHARFDRGEIQEGRRFIEAFLPDYERSGLLNDHLSWHLALFALEQDDLPTALAIYDTRLKPEASTAPPLNAMTDAASLLWRIGLRKDAPDGLPWRDVADHAQARFPNAGFPFADIHMAMLEVMSGEGGKLARRITALESLLAGGRLPAGPVVPGLCRGIAAFASGAYDEAAQTLVPLLAEVVRLGGSGAQRDMISDTAVIACLRSGREAEGRAILRRRMAAH